MVKDWIFQNSKNDPSHLHISASYWKSKPGQWEEEKKRKERKRKEKKSAETQREVGIRNKGNNDGGDEENDDDDDDDDDDDSDKRSREKIWSKKYCLRALGSPKFLPCLSFLSVFILRKRERERERERERQREGDNPKQAPCCQYRAWCRVQNQTMRSWPELKSRVGCLTNWATQGPVFFLVSWRRFWIDSWMPITLSHGSSARW